MDPIIVDFSVVKQKLIKTDEILQMYTENASKLKKTLQACKELKQKLDRTQLENDRCTFSLESLKSKYSTLDVQHKSLYEQKISLEQKYNQQAIVTQQNIKDLEMEVQYLKELKKFTEPPQQKNRTIVDTKKVEELEEKLLKHRDMEIQLKTENNKLQQENMSLHEQISINQEHQKRIADEFKEEKAKVIQDLHSQHLEMKEKIKHYIQLCYDKDIEINRLKHNEFIISNSKNHITLTKHEDKQIKMKMLSKNKILLNAQVNIDPVKMHSIAIQTDNILEPKIICQELLTKKDIDSIKVEESLSDMLKEMSYFPKLLSPMRSPSPLVDVFDSYNEPEQTATLCSPVLEEVINLPNVDISKNILSHEVEPNNIEKNNIENTCKSPIKNILQTRKYRSSKYLQKKQRVMKKKHNILKRRRILKCQDNVLRALQILKRSKINFTISNESTIPINCEAYNLECSDIQSNTITSQSLKRLSNIECLYCKSRNCKRMFMLLNSSGINERLLGFFNIKKETISPAPSRMEFKNETRPQSPLAWLHNQLQSELTPHDILDKLADLVSDKIQKSRPKEWQRLATTESSEYHSEIETDLQHLFENSNNTTIEESPSPDINMCEDIMKLNARKSDLNPINYPAASLSKVNITDTALSQNQIEKCSTSNKESNSVVHLIVSHKLSSTEISEDKSLQQKISVSSPRSFINIVKHSTSTDEIRTDSEEHSESIDDSDNKNAIAPDIEVPCIDVNMCKTSHKLSSSGTSTESSLQQNIDKVNINESSPRSFINVVQHSKSTDEVRTNSEEFRESVDDSDNKKAIAADMEPPCIGNSIAINRIDDSSQSLCNADLSNIELSTHEDNKSWQDVNKCKANSSTINQFGDSSQSLVNTVLSITKLSSREGIKSEQDVAEISCEFKPNLDEEFNATSPKNRGRPDSEEEINDNDSNKLDDDFSYEKCSRNKDVHLSNELTSNIFVGIDLKSSDEENSMTDKVNVNVSSNPSSSLNLGQIKLTRIDIEKDDKSSEIHQFKISDEFVSITVKVDSIDNVKKELLPSSVSNKFEWSHVDEPGCHVSVSDIAEDTLHSTYKNDINKMSIIENTVGTNTEKQQMPSPSQILKYFELPPACLSPLSSCSSTTDDIKFRKVKNKHQKEPKLNNHSRSKEMQNIIQNNFKSLNISQTMLSEMKDSNSNKALSNSPFLKASPTSYCINTLLKDENKLSNELDSFINTFQSNKSFSELNESPVGKRAVKNLSNYFEYQTTDSSNNKMSGNVLNILSKINSPSNNEYNDENRFAAASPSVSCCSTTIASNGSVSLTNNYLLGPISSVSSWSRLVGDMSIGKTKNNDLGTELNRSEMIETHNTEMVDETISSPNHSSEPDCPLSSIPTSPTSLEVENNEFLNNKSESKIDVTEDNRNSSMVEDLRISNDTDELPSNDQQSVEKSSAYSVTTSTLSPLVKCQGLSHNSFDEYLESRPACENIHSENVSLTKDKVMRSSAQLDHFRSIESVPDTLEFPKESAKNNCSQSSLLGITTMCYVKSSENKNSLLYMEPSLSSTIFRLPNCLASSNYSSSPAFPTPSCSDICATEYPASAAPSCPTFPATNHPASPASSCPDSPVYSCLTSPASSPPASPTTNCPASPTPSCPASPTPSCPSSPTLSCPPSVNNCSASPAPTCPASPTPSCPVSPTTSSPASPAPSCPASVNNCHASPAPSCPASPTPSCPASPTLSCPASVNNCPASPAPSCPASPTPSCPASPTPSCRASPTTSSPASPTPSCPSSSAPSWPVYPTPSFPASHTPSCPASPTPSCPESPTPSCPASPTSSCSASPTASCPASLPNCAASSPLSCLASPALSCPASPVLSCPASPGLRKNDILSPKIIPLERIEYISCINEFDKNGIENQFKRISHNTFVPSKANAPSLISSVLNTTGLLENEKICPTIIPLKLTEDAVIDKPENENLRTNYIKIKQKRTRSRINSDSETEDTELKQLRSEHKKALRPTMVTRRLAAELNKTDSTNNIIKSKALEYKSCCHICLTTHSNKRSARFIRKSSSAAEDSYDSDNLIPTPRTKRIRKVSSLNSDNIPTINPTNINRLETRSTRVKELLSKIVLIATTSDPPNQLISPKNVETVKRGRGRPRKYPKLDVKTLSKTNINKKCVVSNINQHIKLENIQNKDGDILQEDPKEKDTFKLAKSEQNISKNNTENVQLNLDQISTIDINDIDNTGDINKIPQVNCDTDMLDDAKSEVHDLLDVHVHPAKKSEKIVNKRKPAKRTKLQSQIMRQMKEKQKMFQQAPVCSLRNNTIDCDVRIKEKLGMSLPKDDLKPAFKTNFQTNKTTKKINVVQNILIRPDCKNPIDLLNLGGTESQTSSQKKSVISHTKKRPAVKDEGDCDILSKIMSKMGKVKSKEVVKSTVIKDIPTGIDEKQWRTKILDMAEVIYNTDVDMKHIYGPQPCKKKRTGILKNDSILPKKIGVLLKKLLAIQNEDDIPEDILLEFKRLTIDKVIEIVIYQVSRDIHDKPDIKYYPAPLMTRTQRIFLCLLVRLEKERVFESIIEMFFSKIQEHMFRIGCGIRQAIPLTRLFLSLCRLHADIHRMRTFCCEAFFYAGDLAVPVFFTVLTSWSEVFPFEADVKNYPIAKVLIQLVHLKTCGKPGYNLLPLKGLLNQYYGYPKERWNCDELFEEVYQRFLANPSIPSDYAVRLFCKNKDTKWVYKKVNEFFKPLIYKIPVENVNFKATTIILMGKICRMFKPNDSHDSKCLIELLRWFEGLLEDNPADILQRSIQYTIECLPKKGKKKQKYFEKTNLSINLNKTTEL